MNGRFPIFDLDGTLIDSDAALTAPFVSLGVPVEQITFGHVVAEECARLGIALDDYLDSYDTDMAQPFDGVETLIHGLDRWAVCSNKHPRSGHEELTRLDWQPAVAMFADCFDGPKQLGPVLDALGLDPGEAVFIGDTAHDRRCAQDAGVMFILAGWNQRSRSEPTDLVADSPGQLEMMLDSDSSAAARLEGP